MPIITQPKHIKLRDSLPGPIKSVVDILLPETDVLGQIAMTNVGEVPESLMNAIKRVSGSLGTGKDLAEQLMTRAPETIEQRPSKLVRIFDKGLSEPIQGIDPNKIALQEKVSGAKPPIRSAIEAPKGFTFFDQFRSTSPTQVMRRDPKLEEIDALWKSHSSIPVPSSEPTKRRLMGKWNTGNEPKIRDSNTRILNEGLRDILSRKKS